MIDLRNHIWTSWKHLLTQQLFVACSGGVDSLTLLYILKDLEFDVSALHVNYNLRGEDSLKDKALVIAFCKTLNIELHVHEVNMKAVLEKEGGNLQAEARRIRYAFFDQFRSQENSLIVLGHHLDDQVETFYMNMFRDSGVSGLACMLPLHDSIWRPFLTIRKEEIRSFAKANKIQWREDVSNSSNKYTRNKWRNLLLPALEQQFPNLQESVAVMVAVFQRKQEELEVDMSKIITRIECNSLLSFTDFDLLDTFQIHELLRQLKIRNSVLDELKKLRNSKVGKFIKIEDEFSSVDRINKVKEGFFLVFKKEFFLPELIVNRVDFLPEKFSKDVLYIEESNIEGELRLRFWKHGDRMKPMGLKGSKLISDIIKDAKLNPDEKNSVLIVEDDREILWCVNLAVSRVAISKNQDEQQQLIQVSIKK
jgi:tRNA(Ile)-lysidine synthase